MHPKIAGWLYTEHHDVINEWNGYYRYDRSEKYTGLGSLVHGMKLNDLHSLYYISTGDQLCRDVKPGETVSVPLFASFMTDHRPGQPSRAPHGALRLEHVRRAGNLSSRSSEEIPFEPWMDKALPALKVTMPKRPRLAVLAMSLQNEAGVVLQRNFTTFLVADGLSPRTETVTAGGSKLRVVRFAPDTFKDAQWSQKQWNVLDGLKVDGAGHGYFEYRLPWPEGLDANQIAGASFTMEASAKQLFGKDREGAKTERWRLHARQRHA